MVKHIVLGIVLAICVIGCNTYDVRPLRYDATLKEVVLVDNPSVVVHGFVENLEDEFSAHGIRVRRAGPGYLAKPKEYVVNYVARQSWDFTTYLSDADIRIYLNGIVMARGHYHHVGQSCSFDLFTKWRGVAWKMQDLYDELLEAYKKK